MNTKKPTTIITNRAKIESLQGNDAKSHLENRRNSKYSSVESTIGNSLLNNLNLHIAVLDENGILISVNKSAETINKDTPLHLSQSAVGFNYFNECKQSIASISDISRKNLSTTILDSILSIFENKQDNFSIEYQYDCLEESKIFRVNAYLVNDLEPKVVITHQLSEKKIPKTATESEIQGQEKKTLSELNALLNASPDIICTLNREGIMTTVNEASHNLLGYSSTEIIGSNFLRFLSQEDSQITSTAFEQILGGMTISSFENTCVHKNGKLVPFLWSLKYDQDLGLLYCVGKDITKRKSLAKALKDDRDQFYNIFLSAPSAICILKGSEHIYEMANPLYLKLINATDIVGKAVHEVLPELSDQGIYAILDHVYQTGETHIDHEVHLKIKNQLTQQFSEFYIDIVYKAYRDSDGIIDGLVLFMNDITAQVVAKKRIENSEKQYRQILETAQEGIWVLDKNSRTTFVNRKICEILGYSENELNGKKDTFFMDANSKVKSLKALRNRKEGKASSYELTFISKKGEEILTSVSSTPIFDDSGNFEGSLGMVSNITEKKHLENLLKNSNRLARIGSWEIDVVNGTVYWSDITKEIREVENDFIPDLKTGIDYFGEGADKIIIQESVQRCIADGTPWDEELQVKTFKGNLIWVRTIGEGIFSNGKCIKIYGSFQDITERKRAVQEIMRSEARLNTAQLIAQVGSWEINLKTNEHNWSAEFYRILEVDDSVTPSYEAFVPLIHEDDRPRAIKIIEEAFSNHNDLSFYFRFNKNNGELGYACSEWRFELDNYGNPSYIYGILRDLTKEKKAENERAKMISDITQRNKDLEQFSYIISHNLRSPVANIIGLAEELKYESHSAESKLMLTEALSSDVKRLENVIVDLNTILQTKRKIDERKEIVNLAELVANIKLSINDLIQNMGVTIKTDFSKIEEVSIIKSYIHSIFYNLISNSIKYRRDDCDALITIESSTNIYGNILLVFKDNGRGIDLVSKGDQIFGLYKRFHSDTEGKGMGLYMVKTQVESLGGKILVSSDVNVGTTFTIEFENNLYR